MKLKELVGGSIIDHLVRRFICRTMPFDKSVIVSIDADPSYLMEYREFLRINGTKLDVTPLTTPLTSAMLNTYAVIVQTGNKYFGLKES